MLLLIRFFLLCFFSCAVGNSHGQAAYLSLQLGLKSDTLLPCRKDDGLLRRQFYVDTALGNGDIRWSWYAAGPSGVDTQHSWRPGKGLRRISGFNQLIFPDTTNTAASALYMDSGGVPGLIPAVAAGTWLSWHISRNSKPSAHVHEWMIVCSTSFRPSRIQSWYAPDTVVAGSNPRIDLTFDRRLAAGEWAGVEFDTLASLATARRMQLDVSDSTASVFLPSFRAGQGIWFRLFTSCVPFAVVDSLYAAHGLLASRLLSLCETGRVTDSIHVRSAAALWGDYLIPGSAFAHLQAFVDTLNKVGQAGPVRCHVKAGHKEKLRAANGLRLLVPGDPLKPLRFASYGKGAKPMLIAGTGSRSMNSSSARVDGIWSVHGTDDLSIEGFELVDSNTAVSGSARMEYGLALFKDSLNGGCHRVRIANCKIRFLAMMSSSGPTAFEDGNKGIVLVNARADALAQGFVVGGSIDQHRAIVLEYDTISGAYAGILAKGMTDNTSPYRRLDSALRISSCAIWNFGEEGIKVMNLRDATIEKNHIHTHPHSSLPAAVPVSERFGIVFTSGHLFSEAGIRVANNRITLTGRALSGAQHVFGIALRQNGGTGNRVEVCGNTITACGNQMANSNFYGIRNTGQRHSLVIDGNTIALNKGRAAGNNAISISNTGQVHQWLLIRNNALGSDTFTGDHTGISQQGQARSVEVCGNAIDSVSARGRSVAVLLHSNGQTIRADSNTICCVTARMGVIALSVRGTAVSGTTRCSIRGNALHQLRADSIGAVVGLELNNGQRHQAEIHANRISALYGNERVGAVSVRTAEANLSNNRIAMLDGNPGGRAQVSGIELQPGSAMLQHNTVYLRGSHADSSDIPVVFRWADSLGSRLLLQNNVFVAVGPGGWKSAIAFSKAGSGLDTLRIDPRSSGNYFHSASGNSSWLYYNRFDRSGDAAPCDFFARVQASGLTGLASGGSGELRLDETWSYPGFLRRKPGYFWPAAVNNVRSTDAVGQPRSALNGIVPGALNDTFRPFSLERLYSCTALSDTTPLYAPHHQVALARWILRAKGSMPGAALRTFAIAIDTALAADSICLWTSAHRDSAYRMFGKTQPSAARRLVFADSLWMSCMDTVWFKLTASVACSPLQKDSCHIRIAYIKNDTDSFQGTPGHALVRLTPGNRPALYISGIDSVCPARETLWRRHGGRLEPGGSWLWYDAGNDSLLGSGDTIRLQFSNTRRLMLRGAGQCDTTSPVYRSVNLFTLPLKPQRIRADRDTLCRGVANWFYPLGGNQGSGGVWSWYAGVAADTFLLSGNALRFAIQRPDTLFLRAEAYCGNSDWVKLPLAVRDALPFEWLGTRSRAWHDVSNWCSEIPGKEDTVHIRKGPSRMPKLTESAAVGTLMLDSGVQVNLDTGVRLWVHGGIAAKGADISGQRAALVCAATDTVRWELPRLPGVDTLVMAGTALRIKAGVKWKHLVLESGLLKADSDTIELETPAVAGKGNAAFGNSWIHGPVMQWLGSDSTIVVPCGDADYAMPLTLRLHRGHNLRGLLVQYRERPGNDSGLKASEFGIAFNFVAGAGVWFMRPMPDTAVAAYDLELRFDGNPDFVHHLQDGAFTILRRNDSSRLASDWEIPAGSRWPGRDSLGTRVSDGFALRKGLSGFSQFGIAGAAAVLPLGFVDVSAQAMQQAVLLRWKMDPTAAVTHFAIEQLHGLHWRTAGIVFADNEKPMAVHSFRVSGLSPGRYFFRVQAFSSEMNMGTSPVRFCDIPSYQEVRVFPNPFHDWLEVRLPENRFPDPVQLELLDVEGRCVYVSKVFARHTCRIDTRNLGTGWYSLVLSSKDSEQAMRIPVFRTQ